MDAEEAIYFRDQLRDARATALRDAEGFQDILFATERLGLKLKGEVGTLKTYQKSIVATARGSPILVCHDEHKHQIVGILTAFDLL